VGASNDCRDVAAGSKSAPPSLSAVIVKLNATAFSSDMLFKQLSGDPHWVPQSKFCNGIGTNLGLYTHVMAYSRDTFDAHLRSVLASVTAKPLTQQDIDGYLLGVSVDNAKKHKSGAAAAATSSQPATKTANVNRAGEDTAKELAPHAFGSKATLADLTPADVATLKEVYRDDYAMLLSNAKYLSSASSPGS